MKPFFQSQLAIAFIWLMLSAFFTSTSQHLLGGGKLGGGGWGQHQEVHNHYTSVAYPVYHEPQPQIVAVPVPIIIQSQVVPVETSGWSSGWASGWESGGQQGHGSYGHGKHGFGGFFKR